MGLRCKRCGSEEHVKNGLMRNKQRYRCKACGLNFTDTPARGKPLALKVAAVLLYVSGLSMNRTAKLLGVSTPTIQAWLEQFAAAYAQKPEPEGRAVVIELDEMWHYLKKSPNRSGSGRLGIVLQASWWTGWKTKGISGFWGIRVSPLFYPAAFGMRGRTGRIGVTDGLSGDALLSTRAAQGRFALRRSCEGSASFVDRSQRDIHNRVGILDHVSEALSDKAALDRR